MYCLQQQHAQVQLQKQEVPLPHNGSSSKQDQSQLLFCVLACMGRVDAANHCALYIEAVVK